MRNLVKLISWSDDLDKLEEQIGYRFKNRILLERALTRKAFSIESCQRGIACEDQEVYRTLGDAVLRTIIVEYLVRTGCSSREEVTQKKMELEREEHLASIGCRLGIGPFIRLGKGEERHQAREQPYVLAETLEAIAGAIHLDGGYNDVTICAGEWFGFKP